MSFLGGPGPLAYRAREGTPKGSWGVREGGGVVALGRHCLRDWRGKGSWGTLVPVTIGAEGGGRVNPGCGKEELWVDRFQQELTVSKEDLLGI